MAASNTKAKFDQGLSFFHKGEYDKALSFFEEVIYDEPDNSEALYNLACCCSMTGQKDNALIFLSRAVRLNPHCQDWAQEDHEFEAVRNEPTFKRLVSGEMVDENEMEGSSHVDVDDMPGPIGGEPDAQAVEEATQEAAEEPQQPEMEAPEEVYEEVEADPSQATVHANPEAKKPPPGLMQDKKIKKKTHQPESALPPCARCDGLVVQQRRSRYSPVLMLLIIYIGVLSMIFMFYSVIGIIGIPVIMAGLYFFSRIDNVWVCENCGAAGKECGQPDDSFDTPVLTS